MLVRASVATLALALLEVEADLVSLVSSAGAVGAVAAPLDEGVSGSSEVLLDVVALLPVGDSGLDLRERERRFAFAVALFVEVSELDLDLRVSLSESEVLSWSESV